MILLDIMPSLLNIHPFHPQVILAHILPILGPSIHLQQHQVPAFQMDLIIITIGVARQFQVKFQIHTLTLQWMCIIIVGIILLLLHPVTGLVEQSNPWLHPWHKEQPGVALIPKELECIPLSLVTGQYLVYLNIVQSRISINIYIHDGVFSNDKYWIVLRILSLTL